MYSKHCKNCKYYVVACNSFSCDVGKQREQEIMRKKSEDPLIDEWQVMCFVDISNFEDLVLK